MKKIVLIMLLLASVITTDASAFETKFLSVNFATMELKHKGEIYTLIEIHNKVKRTWREVTYRCMDERANAVVFRLYVDDFGRYLKLQKVNAKK